MSSVVVQKKVEKHLTGLRGGFWALPARPVLRTVFAALPAKSALSAFVLLLYLFVQAVAVSPAIHHSLHHDSDKAEHSCAATLLSHGQIDTAPAAASLLVPAPRSMESEPACALILPDVRYRLLPERAPPVLL